jgi:L-lactate dehydrogenase complex protein LldG
MVEGARAMSERENIFQRIREALTVKARAHHGEGLPTTAEHRQVMPAVGATTDEQIALFQKNAADLRADFQFVRDDAELEKKLSALRDAEGWRKIASHNGELSGSNAQRLGLPVLFADDGFDKNELEACSAGITECDALVAQTGTVVVTSKTAGGRALSCLPPHHVVIARRSQLVADLPAAFGLIRQKHGANYPSMISFITGPSRTGDIERILVLGAHGPKRLTIFCLQD